MSPNDPFFDAWVRDKLRHAETRTPDHLWDAIRKGSFYYIIADRNKYLLILLFLLLTTGGIAYWGFHPTTAPGALTARSVGGAASPVPGTPASTFPGPTLQTPPTGVPATPKATSTADVRSTRDAVTSTADALATRDAATPDISTPDAAAPGKETPGEMMLAAATPAAAALAAPADLTPVAPPLSLAGNGEDMAIPFRATALEKAPLANTPVLHLRERRHTYIELYAGPDHITHYITASSPAYTAFVQQAKSTEMSYPSFSLGVRLDLPLWTDRWRFKTGIHYAQINEQLHYFNPSVTKTVFQVTTRSVVQPSGAVLQVLDTTTISYKGQYLKQSLNAYRQIDIPVILSYTLLHTPQFELGGSGGAFFNVVSWYGGDILDTTGMPTAIKSGQGHGAANWKKQVGASLYGSLSLRDQLTPRVRVTLEPYLRYDLQNVNRAVNIYRERFVSTGLSLGLQYAIGR
jgi:hypothetical protein